LVSSRAQSDRSAGAPI